MSTTAIELLTQLDFLSRIPTGVKVNVKNYSVIEANSNIGSVTRFLNGESRQETINYITTIINRIIEITPKEDSNTQLILIDRLRKAIEGINNLKVTYESDIYYVSKLTSETTRIEHFINWISTEYKYDSTR